MLSLRTFSRAIPKSCFRPLSSSLLSLSTATRPTFLQSAWKPARPSAYNSFSTTPFRREASGDSDIELAAKLGHERQLEQQSRNSDDVPPEFQAYLERSEFQIQDTPGTQDVIMTRNFGNEIIKVEFSIADLNSLSEEMEELDEDTAMEDEVEDYEEPAAPQTGKRTINQAAMKGGTVDVAPEDSIAPADRAAQGVDEGMAASEEEMPQEYPIRLTATITKSGAGAVEVQATAQDGMISIDNVYFYPKASLADASTPEEMKEAASMYLGPPFANLDQDLQSMLERYLDERGVNSDLATFLPDYVEHKEQREYVAWLANMQKFIEA